MKAAIRRYEAKLGGPITSDQAQAIGEALDLKTATAESDVDLPTARWLVESAKPKSSPLHGLFEWDDVKAAAAQRVSWARKLVASVMVLHVELKRPTRAFQNVTVALSDDKIEHVYKSASDLDLQERNQVGARLYTSISGVCDAAEAEGLAALSSAWKEIIRTVRRHRRTFAK